MEDETPTTPSTTPSSTTYTIDPDFPLSRETAEAMLAELEKADKNYTAAKSTMEIPQIQARACLSIAGYLNVAGMFLAAAIKGELNGDEEILPG